MSRYKGRMSAVVFDRTWPFYVPLRADLVRAKPEIADEALRLGAASEQRNVVFKDVWHTCFCFSTTEAAQTFAGPYGAEIRDARRRINKGVWQIWEEAK